MWQKGLGMAANPPRVYVLTSLIKDILCILANLLTLCNTCTKYAKNSSNRRRPCVVSWLPWPPISSLGSRAHRATISRVNCPANPLKFRYQTGRKEHVKSVTYINIRFKWFKYDLELVKLYIYMYIYIHTCPISNHVFLDAINSIFQVAAAHGEGTLDRCLRGAPRIEGWAGCGNSGGCVHMRSRMYK